MRMLGFFRYFLLALVALRLFTGAAWAMPTPVVSTAPMTEEMPCHAMESDDSETAQTDSTAHTSHSTSALCHVCCMGVLHTLTALDIPAALPRHAPPAHHAQEVARWQHTPDLRPPIQSSEK